MRAHSTAQNKLCYHAESGTCDRKERYVPEADTAGAEATVAVGRTAEIAAWTAAIIWSCTGVVSSAGTADDDPDGAVEVEVEVDVPATLVTVVVVIELDDAALERDMTKKNGVERYSSCVWEVN